MNAVALSKRKKIRNKIGSKQIQYWMMCIIPVLLVFIFSYVPMFGIIIAFKDYRYDLGIFGSQWIGFGNFKFFLQSNDFIKITWNTLYMNFLFIIFGIIAALAVAILFYYIHSRKVVKTFQTIFITPHFLSYVVVGYMVYAILQPQYGVMNSLLTKVGISPVDWYSAPKAWPAILLIASVWKNVGMDSVIYYAALMGIDSTLFDAAAVDGAGDWKIIKHIIKLKEKKYRKEYNEYIIEGAKIVQEAIQEKVKIKQIIISENAINTDLILNHLKEELQKINYIIVPSNIFKLISEVEKPQGVLAIIEKEKQEENIDVNQDIILALDDIQDPGNLGTIIRTADSVGLNQILISKGTIDPYNPKVIRSTMGAIFRVKIIECENLGQTLKNIQKNNYQIVVTDLNTDKSIYDIKLQKNVIIIGNEANGVSEEIKNMADTRAIIPMFGKTESLNASIATGVILYEYVRQKLQEK